MRERVGRAMHARIVEPVSQLLRQGVSPRAIAVSMSAGAVIGVFPILGSTTVICLALALVWRLNLVAIQALNWLVYPLQLVLIVPFVRLGEHIAGRPPSEFSVAGLEAVMAQGWAQALAQAGHLLLNGILGWSVVAIPVGGGLYCILVPLLRRIDVAALIRRGDPTDLG